MFVYFLLLHLVQLATKPSENAIELKQMANFRVLALPSGPWGHSNMDASTFKSSHFPFYKYL